MNKKYYFTVMKIDTLQMKKNKDGSYTGDVTPTRFTFATEQLIYPTKITQVSVKDKTEALFYVQAPYKVDLQGDLSGSGQQHQRFSNAPVLRMASSTKTMMRIGMVDRAAAAGRLPEPKSR